jgi:hypothetical protein
MSTNINTYTALNPFAVLAASGITTAVTPVTTITNGTYGSFPTASYTGSFNTGSAGAISSFGAQTQLTTLVNAILATPVTGTTSGGSGAITYFPGRYNSGSTIIYSPGTNIILNALGNSNAQFFFTAGSSITFGSIASITLINGATNCNVFWLAGEDVASGAPGSISFTGTSPPEILGIYIAQTAISFANSSNVLGRVYAKTANVTFAAASTVDAMCSIVCYAKGSLILTEQGYTPIENINVGDKIVTKGKIFNNSFIQDDSELRSEPVKWISKFKVTNLNTESKPICIKKDALGENYPFQDLYVSPNHSLLINNKMTVARNIMNGTTIYQDNECNDIEYYHIECEYHSAIFANGVLSESYLDVDNRYVFENNHIIEPKYTAEIDALA